MKCSICKNGCRKRHGLTSVSSLAVGEGALNRMPLWPTFGVCWPQVFYLSSTFFSSLSSLLSSHFTSPSVPTAPTCCLLTSVSVIEFDFLNGNFCLGLASRQKLPFRRSNFLTDTDVNKQHDPFASSEPSHLNLIPSLVLGCSARSAREQTLVSASFYMKPKKFEEFRAEVPHLSWFKTQRKGSP